MRALRCPSPRHRPSARRPSAPTSPLPPSPSWRVGSARPVASSAPARAARRLSAPLALPRHHRDLTLRAQRCPSPCRCPSARRPSAPTSPLTPVPSWRVDAARPVASSAPARAARRVSAPLALPRHHRDITLRALRCPSPRHRPSARRPFAPTSPLPPSLSWRVGSARPVASSAPAFAARRLSAPLALPRHHRDLTLRAQRCPSPCRRPSARRPSAPTSPLPPAPSWRVDAARSVASSAPARAARRVSAPLELPRHHRDITSRAQRCPSPRRRPGARRPSAPTSPLPTAPSWRVDAACPVASSAPARAARRVSAPLALLRNHRNLTLRTQRCPSPRRSPRARRPSAPTSPLPPAPSWHVDAVRLVASPAPARAARRLSAPLARPRHCRDITLRTRAPLDAHPCATVQARVDLPRRRLVVARAVVARLPFSPRLAPRSERARCLRASATTVNSPPSRALCAVHHRATPQDRVDCPRRRRLRRPRRRNVLTIFPFSRTRRRLTPRAERARRLRASANPVAPFRCSTSP